MMLKKTIYCEAYNNKKAWDWSTALESEDCTHSTLLMPIHLPKGCWIVANPDMRSIGSSEKPEHKLIKDLVLTAPSF